ncbi:hypothetical protein [Noviherbaspirillum malthae]|jgi:hypothetical protein|uniref:hypothetical protein n=1 Tax=Noviherbaspirillum malthae TaxID=1260987 RepID=UPI00188FACB7|nr:hypothetical protein [Noviherbaspirillum malthae]
MSEIIRSRSIAEHLCTLASLLEAEALKAGVLGVPVEKNLRSEARKVRAMAEQLWEVDSAIDVSAAPDTAVARTGAAGTYGRRGGQVKLVSG